VGYFKREGDNIMDIETTNSRHTQYAEKNGKGTKASKEGDKQANLNGKRACQKRRLR
jgi:hypothetical protein